MGMRHVDDGWMETEPNVNLDPEMTGTVAQEMHLISYTQREIHRAMAGCGAVGMDKVAIFSC